MGSFQDAGRPAPLGLLPPSARGQGRRRRQFSAHAARLSLLLLAAALPALASTGCGAHRGRGAQAATALDVPDELDARGFAELSRSYRKLDPEDPQRVPVRARLVRYLLKDAEHAQAANEYEAAVEKLAKIAELYRPNELKQGLLPELLPVATYLRKEGEKRGDEARVLSALWIQASLKPDDPEPRAQYKLLRQFGDEARENLGVSEYFSGLIDVLSEHARLTPAPEVLASLADLYVERRARLLSRGRGEDGLLPSRPAEITLQEYRERSTIVHRAPFDVAAVYLVHAEFANAAARLRKLETVDGLEPRLRALVEAVADDRAEAAEALLALYVSYAEFEQRDVARALCTYAVRHFPSDARFPRCLGSLAAVEDDYSGAIANYADAIKLAPDERALYDEALEVLANLMRGEMFDNDPTDTRSLASQAITLLDERVKRWPDVPPPVALDELELAVGLAEMNAGNAQEARAHFEASLRKRETTRALVQLGQLEAKLGLYQEALAQLRKALEKTSKRDVEQTRQRAQIVETIGDVQRAMGTPDEAKTSYGEALLLWDASVRSNEDGGQRAFGHIRRGVLLSRLGRSADSLAAFEQAMQAASDNRETYAQVLAHLVVIAPEPELADGILRRAQRQLTLEPEWRSYFSLWVKAVYARAEQPAPPEVERLLVRLSRSDAWWGYLARFGAGLIDFAELTRLAKTRGERTEADFYEGVRRVGAGDIAGARTLLQKVLDSLMVGFYEYQMAQELLLLDDASLRRKLEKPPAPAAPTLNGKPQAKPLPGSPAAPASNGKPPAKPPKK
jgi:tetratricopeptide (TPR) repeat protein